jgi:hypothetical protein
MAIIQVKEFMEFKSSLIRSVQTSANDIEAVVAANIHQWMENNYTLHKSLFPSGFPAQITRCGYIH